jgi:hypothetical protein
MVILPTRSLVLSSRPPSKWLQRRQVHTLGTTRRLSPLPSWCPPLELLETGSTSGCVILGADDCQWAILEDADVDGANNRMGWSGKSGCLVDANKQQLPELESRQKAAQGSPARFTVQPESRTSRA